MVDIIMIMYFINNYKIIIMKHIQIPKTITYPTAVVATPGVVKMNIVNVVEDDVIVATIILEAVVVKVVMVVIVIVLLL